MIMFSAMVLVLTVGAVCSLLYRQVFLPIKQLADFTEDSSGDTLNDEFPEVSGEVARLANAFQKMTRRVRELEGQLQEKEREAIPPDSLP
jgi:nitrogen fixation/metabolism regulation signal transduction histidine kinase